MTWGYELERVRRRRARNRRILRVLAWLAVIGVGLVLWLGLWGLTALIFGVLG